MRPLRKAGIVEAFPGPKGGFRLGRPPAEINVLELIDIMDRPVDLAHCQKDPAKCPWKGRCALAPMWRRASERIRAIFAEETLDRVLRDYERSGGVIPAPEQGKRPPAKRRPKPAAKPAGKKRRCAAAK